MLDSVQGSAALSVYTDVALCRSPAAYGFGSRCKKDEATEVRAACSLVGCPLGLNGVSWGSLRSVFSWEASERCDLLLGSSRVVQDFL